MTTEQIKETRVRLDLLSELVSELKPIRIEISTGEEYYHSVELIHAKNNILLSKCWLGKMLGAKGVSSPYKNDGNRKQISDIEPTADKNTGLSIEEEEHLVYTGKNHIEKIDWIRTQLIYLSENIINLRNGYCEAKHVDYEDVYQNQAHIRLCEARFWLGFELERIRNSGDIHKID